MITTKNEERFWADKYVISIGNAQRCDMLLKLPYEVLITIKYDFYKKNYVLFNSYKNPNILFCKEPVMQLELGRLNKIYFKNTEEFLTIRVLERQKMYEFPPLYCTYQAMSV